MRTARRGGQSVAQPRTGYCACAWDDVVTLRQHVESGRVAKQDRREPGSQWPSKSNGLRKLRRADVSAQRAASAHMVSRGLGVGVCSNYRVPIDSKVGRTCTVGWSGVPRAMIGTFSSLRTKHRHGPRHAKHRHGTRHAGRPTVENRARRVPNARAKIALQATSPMHFANAVDSLPAV